MRTVRNFSVRLATIRFFPRASPTYRWRVSAYEDLDAFKACHQLTLAVHRLAGKLGERGATLREIGRGACRGRVEISGGGGSFQKKKKAREAGPVVCICRERMCKRKAGAGKPEVYREMWLVEGRL